MTHDPLGRRNNIHWLWLSLLVIVLDHGSKFLIERDLPHFAVQPLIPHFNIANMHNTGAAFSMFNTAPAAAFIVLGAVVSGLILAWMRRHPYDQRLLGAAFSLILGGALGNAIDRALRGYVVDFVDFYVGSWHFAAFNVADSAITLGAALLILEMLLSHRAERKALLAAGAASMPPSGAAPPSGSARSEASKEP